MDVFKSEFIKCECYGEGMGIDYDPEDKLYYFSYWQNALSNGQLSWKDRLRYCWQVLTKGKAFNDELILNQESTDKLVSFLNKNRDGFPTGNIDFGTSME